MPTKHHLCLQRLRDAANLTQKQLAQLAGIPWRTLVNIEVGQRRLTEENAEAISAVTGASAQSLLMPDGMPQDFEGARYTAATYQSHHAKYSPHARADDADLAAEENALFLEMAAGDIDQLCAAFRAVLLQSLARRRLESAVVASGYALAKMHRDFGLSGPTSAALPTLPIVEQPAEPSSALAEVLERVGPARVESKSPARKPKGKRRPATSRRKR